MSKTAILVDGGYYRKLIVKNFGKKSSIETANGLVNYCHRHLTEHQRSHELYRIYYYDCPPVDSQMYHPLYKKTINMKLTPDYTWMTEYLALLKEKRKIALRLGKLDAGNCVYTLTYDAVKKLLSGNITTKDLCEYDFMTSFKQKGVDMKIGIDIATLSLKKQVDQIVLIAGDSDFVPAAKLARREGIDVILDPINAQITSDLLEHIDGKRSCGDPYSSKNKTNIEAYKI